jgi:hypothetical protein
MQLLSPLESASRVSSGRGYEQGLSSEPDRAGVSANLVWGECSFVVQPQPGILLFFLQNTIFRDE